MEMFGVRFQIRGSLRRALLPLLVLLATECRDSPAADAKTASKRPPAEVTFYLSALDDPKQQNDLRVALMQVASVSGVSLNPQGKSVTVKFDSHVVSYHQVAQAIADAGNKAGKKYAPAIKFQIPAYAQRDNAAKIDAILAGKRLNQRVKIEPVDKTRGEFVVHFLPLETDSSETGPQGFNGGHLHHPIHDAPPRGLGLEFRYLTDEQGN
jgi:copper chaperone CopZ